MKGHNKNATVRVEELVDIPESELEALEESYLLDGAIDIERIQQQNGLWALRVTFVV